MACLIGLAVATLGLRAEAADWVAWVGEPGLPGDVWVLPGGLSQGTQVPSLSGIELLPIDYVGRTRAERFLPERPRRELVGLQAARLVLPGDHGSVYAFRRDDSGSSEFGLFRVGDDGSVLTLYQAPGAGPTGDDAPWLPQVGYDRSGRYLLLATRVEAGGDVIEIDVTSGLSEQRTSSLPPQHILPQTLALASGFGSVLTASGPLRFVRVAGAQAAPVPMPSPAPTYFAPGIARSGDDTVLGYLGGDGPQAVRIWTVEGSGPAVSADMPPSNIEGPGFLPESVGGPYFVLSQDGQAVGYRAAVPKTLPEVGLSREVFRAGVPTTSGPFHASSDALFADTIDEIGVLRFLPTGELAFGAGAVGDSAPGAIERLDIFQVDSAGAVQNQSLSSGIAAPPFALSGELDPEEGLYWQPGGSEILLHDSQSGGTGRLLLIDPVNGSTVLQGNVKSLDAIAWTGSRFVVAVRRDFASKRVEVAAVAGGIGYSPFASLPEDTLFDPIVPIAPGVAGARMKFGAGQWLVRLDANNMQGQVLIPQPLTFTDTFGASTGGGLRFSTPQLPGIALGWGGGAIEFAVGPDGPITVLPAR